jgi:hypothetical protein
MITQQQKQDKMILVQLPVRVKSFPISKRKKKKKKNSKENQPK